MEATVGLGGVDGRRGNLLREMNTGERNNIETLLFETELSTI